MKCFRCGRKERWLKSSYCKECRDAVNAEARRRLKARMRFMGDKMYDGTMKQCSFNPHGWPRKKEHWSKNYLAKDWLQAYCRHCADERALFRVYGIRQPDKVSLHQAQNGVCAICETSLTTNGDACVDHDHTTGWKGKGDSLRNYTVEQRRRSVRGLLCNGCNKIFQHIVEMDIDPETWVTNALKYELNPPAKGVIWE